jgi:NAD(P)-dependent dehydrogenase (short-subunit alcohol dehydrogenase family)
MGDGTPRTVVLTGATRGIGRALVGRLVELGHTVIGCGRSRSGVDELRSEFPAPSFFDAVDVASWPEVEAWANGVLSKREARDLLVNNAGVINRTSARTSARL